MSNTFLIFFSTLPLSTGPASVDSVGGAFVAPGAVGGSKIFESHSGL